LRRKIGCGGPRLVAAGRSGFPQTVAAQGGECKQRKCSNQSHSEPTHAACPFILAQWPARGLIGESVTHCRDAVNPPGTGCASPVMANGRGRAYAVNMNDLQPNRDRRRQAALADLEKLRQPTDMFGRSLHRAASHFGGREDGTTDPIEIWGRRIGRALGAVGVVVLGVYLFLTYVVR
jgi:hypothetical protein